MITYLGEKHIRTMDGFVSPVVSCLVGLLLISSQLSGARGKAEQLMKAAASDVSGRTLCPPPPSRSSLHSLPTDPVVLSSSSLELGARHYALSSCTLFLVPALVRPLIGSTPFSLSLSLSLGYHATTTTTFTTFVALTSCSNICLVDRFCCHGSTAAAAPAAASPPRSLISGRLMASRFTEIG